MANESYKIIWLFLYGLRLQVCLMMSRSMNDFFIYLRGGGGVFVYEDVPFKLQHVKTLPIALIILTRDSHQNCHHREHQDHTFLSPQYFVPPPSCLLSSNSH